MAPQRWTEVGGERRWLGSIELTTSLTRARNALLIVLGILAVLWIIQIINNADHYRLSYDFAIQPRIASDLPYILTAPFLHWSWAHIEGNSVPLVVLGFLAAYRNIPRFIGVTFIVILTSGLAFWVVASVGSDAVGASGVIFGWFGYVMVRGFFSRDRIDMIVGVLAVIYYISILTLLLPASHLAYQDHIGGFLGGVFCGWLFRARPIAGAVGTREGSGRPSDVASPTSVISSPLSHVEDELAALRKQIVGHRQSHDDRSEK